MIRLVVFDALHTVLTPRLPIYIQYSQTFEPYLGVLDPDALKGSFKVAFKQVQIEKPVYESGAQGWWGEVIKLTAIGAGADPKVVQSALPTIVPLLMQRFSSKEGYRLFNDSIPVLERLKEMNIKTALISNADSRMRLVLEDLSTLPYFSTVLISEEEGIEKPAKDIFLRALARTDPNLKPEEAVHVGDELEGDYHGARNAGLHALLIRRPGPEGDEERKEVGENLSGVQTVTNLLVSITDHRPSV